MVDPRRHMERGDDVKPSNDIHEARATAIVLRATARAVRGEQESLRLRLIRAADALDSLALLALRYVKRIEQLERRLQAGRS